MPSVPPDAAASIVRGMGLYLRSVPVTELPKEFRRWQSFRPATLARHRDELLDALEDETLRAEILEWLDDAKPKLPKSDAHNLRLALERPPDWTSQLETGLSQSPDGRPDERTPADLEARVEDAKARAKHARDELKAARRDARVALGVAEERARSLGAEIERLSAELSAARAEAAAAERDAVAARTELEQERRRARRDVERANESRDRAREDLKRARREAAAARRAAVGLETRLEVLEAAAKANAQAQAPPPSRRAASRGRARRRPLSVPPGRPGDDPQTLEDWLGRAGVRLLVDGYNVTKAQGGFGELELEAQRERLVQEVRGLALRNRVPVTVVFDGSDVPPGTGRRTRGPVTVEYSRLDETADDHLIALLRGLPPDPVIVTTSDKELQARAAALGATIASSDQLLQLIR